MKEIDNIKYPIGGYAPGEYICRCYRCGEQFIGDKRAYECEKCAKSVMNNKNNNY